MNDQQRENLEMEINQVTQKSLQNLASAINKIAELPQKTEAEAFYKAAKLAEARTVLTKAIKTLK